jgi:hypothetical protein
MCPCSSICHRYKVTTKTPNNIRYKIGQKWCGNCTLFMYYDDDVKCPCCKATLRVTAKSRKSRTKRQDSFVPH